jgi:hypothetical protein
MQFATEFAQLFSSSGESTYDCLIIGNGLPPDLPSFRSSRTYSQELWSAIEEYSDRAAATLLYIFPGSQAQWPDIQAAILAGFPVCIHVNGQLASPQPTSDWHTFSHTIMLFDVFKAAIYADAREEIFEPPVTYLKDRIVLPAVLYFEMRGAIDPPAAIRPLPTI